MKKIISILPAALALIALSAACNKVNPVDETPVSKTITIKATISDAATRVTFDPAFDGDSKPTAMAHTWQTGDKLRITDASDASKTALFDLVDGAGTATGTFEGTGFEAASYNVEAVPQGSFSSGFTQTQAKDGATDHLQFVATATGVTDLEDFSLTETSGIVGVIAKLPDDVAGTINALEIEAKVTGLPVSIKVTVNLTTPADVDSDDILKIYANAPTGFAIPAGAEVFLRFKSTNENHAVYTRYQKFDTALLPVEGKFNYVKFNCSHIDQSAGANDDGTSADPYLIADKYQMQAMHVLAVPGNQTYFKMMDDVDLEGITWTPLNVPSPYDIGIDFNGNGKTVNHLSSTGKYASFAGVLNGSVYNVFFDNATITTSQDKAGVVAGYLGSSGSGISAECRDITVRNSKVTSTSNNVGGLAGIASKLSNDIVNCHVIDFEGSGVYYVGGLLGCIDGQWTVSDCSSSGTISSSNTESNKDICLGGLVGDMKGNATVTKCSSSVRVNQTTNGRDLGGLVGRLQTGTVEKSFSTGNVTGKQRNVGGFIGLITNTQGTSSVSNCYSTGNVSANAYSGGFLGLHEKGTASISNCYATGDVNGSGFGLGGIIGFAGAEAMTMSKTVAWNGHVVPANYGSANWSSGAVVGVTFPTCTLTDNYRSPSTSLTAFWVPDADYDHPNVSTTAPLVVKDITTGELRPTTATGTGNTNDNYPQFAYHGKHVATGTTLSTLASTTLGWSSAVWDFSGDVPTLK